MKIHLCIHLEISHLRMAGEEEQTDSAGKYAMGGSGSSSGSGPKYWPTVCKCLELVRKIANY